MQASPARGQGASSGAAPVSVGHEPCVEESERCFDMLEKFLDAS